MNNADKWVFKSGGSIFIKCYFCEKDFDVKAVRREDGFCPSCHYVEIDLSDEPYQPKLQQLEGGEDE